MTNCSAETVPRHASTQNTAVSIIVTIDLTLINLVSASFNAFHLALKVGNSVVGYRHFILHDRHAFHDAVVLFDLTLKLFDTIGHQLRTAERAESRADERAERNKYFACHVLLSPLRYHCGQARRPLTKSKL